MRLYNIKLVEAIKNKAFTRKQNEVEIICRPIPDQEREHALDPRILELALKKNQHHLNTNTEFSLSAMRNRSDMISYDLTTSNIIHTERLINLEDHMINVHVFTPENIASDALIIFYHGGGFSSGDITMYKNTVKYLCEQTEAIVLFPEYRLAPECPFPCGVNDAYDVLTWAYDHASDFGCDSKKLVIVGDSAGGNLCHACMIKDNQQRIRLCVSIYPVCELNMIDNNVHQWSYQMHPVIDAHKEIAYGRIDRLKNTDLINELYVRDSRDYKNPLVSSLYYDYVSKFPKTIIIASEFDFLRVGSDYFVEKLYAAGVDVTSVLYLGCDHGFLTMLGIIPQAEDMCQLIASEIKNL
jgi:acetyl esterase